MKKERKSAESRGENVQKRIAWILILLIILPLMAVNVSGEDLKIIEFTTLGGYYNYLEQSVLPHNFIPYESIASFGRFDSFRPGDYGFNGLTRGTYCLTDENNYSFTISMDFAEPQFGPEQKREYIPYDGGDPRKKPEGEGSYVRREGVVYFYPKYSATQELLHIYIEINGVEMTVSGKRGHLNTYPQVGANTMLSRLLSAESDVVKAAMDQLKADMPERNYEIILRAWRKGILIGIAVGLAGTAAVVGIYYLRKRGIWKIGKKPAAALAVAVFLVMGLFAAQRYDYRGAYQGMTLSDLLTVMPPPNRYENGYYLKQGVVYYTNRLGYGIFVEYATDENGRVVVRDIDTYSKRQPTALRGALLRKGMSRQQVLKLMGDPSDESKDAFYMRFQSVDGTKYAVHFDTGAGSKTVTHIDILEDHRWISYCAAAVMVSGAIVAIVWSERKKRRRAPAPDMDGAE